MVFGEAKTKWLSSLSTGDKVAIAARAYGVGMGYSIGCIHRITKTLFIVKFQRSTKEYYYRRFRRGDGSLVGAGPYEHTCLTPVTDDVLDSRRRGFLLRRISQVQFSKLPTDVLEQLFKILKEVKLNEQE